MLWAFYLIMIPTLPYKLLGLGDISFDITMGAWHDISFDMTGQGLNCHHEDTPRSWYDMTLVTDS